MKSKADIFDQMLKITANLGYPFEKPFYKNNMWKDAKTVVDIGCGNAEYISLLSRDNPQKNFIGIEKNSMMQKIASKHNGDKIQIINKDFAEIELPEKFDFLIARRSIVHLASRQTFYDWLHKNGNSGAGVLIIETDMVNFNLDGKLPLFAELYSHLQNQNTADSYGVLRNMLEKEFSEEGLQHVATMPLIVNTDLHGIKEQFYIYLRLTEELALDGKISYEHSNELFNWLLDKESYAENHIFGMLFKL